MFQIGDQVVIRKDSRYYNSTPSNPPNSVTGTIIHNWDYSCFDAYNFRVEWSNRTMNSYREQDLELVKEVDIEDWV